MTRSPGNPIAPGTAHIPELDGVRGLAIALVMLRHLSLLDWFRSSPNLLDRGVTAVTSAGWVGVDLFFVLSGFLITGLLLDARDRSVPLPSALGRFYWRRCLRIFPLYYAACAILFFLVPHLPYFRAQPEVAILPASAPWYWTYSINFLEILGGGRATPFNTGHFWSLAVEEQFYLVWPFVVLCTPRRVLGRVLAGLILAGPLVRWALLASLVPGAGATAAYTLSVARVDILGMGAMLAVLSRGAPATWRRIGGWAPWLGAVAVAAFAALELAWGTGSASPPMQRFGYTIVALGMAALVAYTLQADRRDRPLPRLFRSAPLRTLGKYSYCLYIVHYPLMVILDLVRTRIRIPALGGSMLPAWVAYGSLLVGASFAIAWVSWRCLERPMLSLKDVHFRFTAPTTAEW